MSSANRKIVAPDANRCTEASVPKGLRPARAASDFSSEFETVGKKEESGGGGRRRRRCGVFASKPQRRQSSHLQWNGKKEKRKGRERKEEMKKDEKRGGRVAGGAGGGRMEGLRGLERREHGQLIRHPSEKVRIFVGGIWEEQRRLQMWQTAGYFPLPRPLKRAPVKNTSASKHFGPTLGHLSCLQPSQLAKREQVPVAHAKKTPRQDGVLSYFSLL